MLPVIILTVSIRCVTFATMVEILNQTAVEERRNTLNSWMVGALGNRAAAETVLRAKNYVENGGKTEDAWNLCSV